MNERYTFQVYQKMYFILYHTKYDTLRGLHSSKMYIIFLSHETTGVQKEESNH